MQPFVIVGKRGSCEIVTCLYNYLTQLPKKVSEATLYSDTCGGQNRYRHVAALLLNAVQSTFISVIHQKFLESGHSQMEVDSMHSAIECTKKFLTQFTQNLIGIRSSELQDVVTHMW